MFNARALVALFCFFVHLSSAHAAIYGTDNRQDIYQVPWLRPVASSVAVAVGNIFLQSAPEGTFTVTDVSFLGESKGGFMCDDERFSEQPSIGVCTGFLIGDRYLVTAGHCVLPAGIVDNEFHPFCEAFSWIFDYNLTQPGPLSLSAIPADRVYGCKRVIRAENIERNAAGLPGRDFALIELDRPVTGRTPLPVAHAARPGDFVYTIGHPTGMPAKYSGAAPVLSEPQPHYFAVNLDTLGGNSGGPVFNVRNQVTGILVSGHQVDHVQDPRGCYRVNQCDSAGKHCREDSPLQESNFIQRIETVLPYIPAPALTM